MMFRSSIFALMAAAMTFSAEGVNITVNATVDSRIDSVELKAGSQTLGPVAKDGSASWQAWELGTAYTPTFTGVAPGYEGRWTVTMSGQTTLSGGEENTIIIQSSSYAGCTLSFTAQAKTYTVTLDRQSGSGGSSSVTATYDSAMPAAAMPTRAGYSFGGYYTEANGGGTQYYNADGTSARSWDETSDTTLYAKWTAATYTVELDRQSGKGGSSSVKVTYGSAMPTPITIPTRAGYTFDGYYTHTYGDGTQYYTASGASAKNWNETSVTKLYANWKAKKYTVALDRQSGSGGTDSVAATYGSTMPSITTPTRTGYTFGGYYALANGEGTQYYSASGASANNWNIANATTLYAKWTAKECNLTFAPNGGKFPDGSTSALLYPNANLSMFPVYGSSSFSSVVKVSRTGYAFAGWYTAAFGGEQVYDANGQAVKGTYWTESRANGGTWKHEGDLTLYAHWTGSGYTVTFNANGGTGTMEPMFCDYDVPTNLTACAFTRDGWGFEKWTNDAGEEFGDRARVTNLTATASTTLYACWTGVTYAVTFDARDTRGNGVMTNAAGEAVSVLTNDYVVGDAWGDLPAPTNVHALLEFAGWKYVDAQGRKRDVPATVPPPSAGVTNLVATWTSVDDDLAIAVDVTGLEFDTFGTVGTKGEPTDPRTNYNWFVQSDITLYSTKALQSGSLPINVGDSKRYVSWLTTKVDGKGVLSFWWKCDAKPVSIGPYPDGVGDSLRFGLYDATEGITNEVVRLTNHVDWCQVVYTNEAETAVSLAWAFVYVDDVGLSNGGGTGWVDHVTWTPNNQEYFVCFNANGGDGTMDEQTFTNGVASCLAANAFTRTGYSFNGWATNETGAVIYDDCVEISNMPVSGETVTLYAVWKPKSYTITFTGGEVDECITQEYGTEVKPPADPSRTGYTFAGWSPAVPATVPAENMTCTAQWTVDTYMVVFDANGGDGSWCSQMDDGEAISAPTVTRTGYKFTGWTPSVAETVSGGETYKAQWERNKHQVTLSPNGGEGDGSAVVEYGTRVGDIEVPTRTGHTFVGWFTKAEGGDLVDDEMLVTGDMELFAQWMVNSYTLTFDSNGGSEVEPITQDYGTAVTAPDDPICAGYKFAGWQPALPETMPAEDMLLTAQWTANVPEPTPGEGEASNPENPGNPENPESESAQGLTMLWTPVLPDGANVGDAVFVGEIAEAYDGYVQDAAGNVMGTIFLKAAKAKNAISKVTANVQLLAEKKITVKGTLDTRTGRFEATDKFGRALSLLVGANSLSGTYGTHFIDGAQNKFSTKNSASKAIGSAVLEKWKGVTTVAWRLAGDGSPYHTLSVSVANKGKAKITGTLADGTKVSAKSLLIVGENWSCIPVVYAKKNVRLAFNLWLPNGTAATSAAAPVVVGLDGAIVGKPGSLKGGTVFQIDAAALGSVLGKVLLPYLPDGLAVTGGAKWTLPKAGKVVYVKDTTNVDEAKTGENPSGLKLTYKAKEGTFKGSFKAYADVGGKPKATTVNVSGVVVDGIGYGAAMVKKVGSVPVKIE